MRLAGFDLISQPVALSLGGEQGVHGRWNHAEFFGAGNWIVTTRKAVGLRGSVTVPSSPSGAGDVASVGGCVKF